MTQTLQQFHYVEAFRCLADKCEDTCCHGWGMQLGAKTLELYKKEAPELLDAVTSGEAEHIMRRDPKTDFCVKYENGLCGIHRDKGSEFLGDACNFFPRITRNFGSTTVMSAALSCPEITRLTLFGENPFELKQTTIQRLPESVKSYLPDAIDENQALGIITALITFVEQSSTPERAMASLVVIAESLSVYPEMRWKDAIPMLIKFAEGRLPEPQTNPNDGYVLLQTLAGLIHASKNAKRPRLMASFRRMEQGLGCTIDWTRLEVLLNQGEEDFPKKLAERGQSFGAPALGNVLKRWLQAELSMAAFPFSGFGSSLFDRAIILSVRFATVRLALQCHIEQDGTLPDRATIVQIVQGIARIMDHLAEPELSQNLYRNAGWNHVARARALVGDVV